MRLKKFLGITLAFCLCACTVSNVKAAEIAEDKNETTDNISETIKFKEQNPLQASPATVSDLEENTKTTSLTSTADVCEPNDTRDTAYPYNSVENVEPQIAHINRSWALGMKHANLDSESDVDWYSINLTKDQMYFADLRNIGRMNWFIEVYYQKEDGSWWYFTSDPSKKSEFMNHPEKYIYFTANVTGTHYIKVTSGDDWQANQMDYFFYVGPTVQYFDIVDLPTMGGVKLMGTGYQTYTVDLTDTIPASATVVNLSVTDSLSSGYCSLVNKSLTANGHTYYNKTGSNVMNGMSGVELSNVWTIGGKCSHGSHTPYWSARLNGRVRCVMEPYPGNELW